MVSSKYQMDWMLCGLKKLNVSILNGLILGMNSIIKALNFYGKNKVLPKPDEYFYHEKNIIIKYFQDSNKAKERVIKSSKLKNLFQQL